MADYWLDLQDHTGPPRGFAPFLGNNFNYPVFRNVVTHYQAQNNGSGDQKGALQNAVNDDGQGGSRFQLGTTCDPAVVYLPPGVYQLQSTLDLRMGTVITGDPNNPPTIMAGSSFNGSVLINGTDFATGSADQNFQNGHAEDSFSTLLKNVILDITQVRGRPFTALQWGVAQACGITNVSINMPNNSTTHTGVVLGSPIGGGSTIAVTDMKILGGFIGIQNSNQQCIFKSISFTNCNTGYRAQGGFTSILQGATFQTCSIGADITSSHGTFVLLDCVSDNSGPVLRYHDSSFDQGNRNNQVVIENLTVQNNSDPNNPPPVAVDESGNSKLDSTSHVETWVFGNVEPGTFQHTGQFFTTGRASGLLDQNGKYFTKQQPTYQNVPTGQFANVKADPNHKVFGDGRTDDSASLNAILVQNAQSGKISYFPYGVYIVQNTLYIPPGTRIVGEAWSVISGQGSKFHDPNNPAPVVMVGQHGETGIAEIQEMRFTVAEQCPGAIIVQINMSGKPGDVGLWNCFATIGGTKDTLVSTTCTDTDVSNTRASFLTMHLTDSSSAYIENFWGWAADHDVDGGPAQNICAGRGLLVQATKGTWLVGTGFEHHWLYNYNFHNASNVYAGHLQAETPYFQGNGAINTVPSPWTPDVARFGDPDYLWCDPNDQRGRTALAANIDGGSNLFLYNTAFWAFFHDSNRDPDTDSSGPQFDLGRIQTNMIRVANNPSNLCIYAINTRSADVMVFDGRGNPSQFNHPGSWDGAIAAYRTFAA